MSRFVCTLCFKPIEGKLLEHVCGEGGMRKLRVNGDSGEIVYDSEGRLDKLFRERDAAEPGSVAKDKAVDAIMDAMFPMNGLCIR